MADEKKPSGKLKPEDQKLWNAYVSEEVEAQSEEDFEALLDQNDQEQPEAVAPKIDTPVAMPKKNNNAPQIDRRTEEKIKKGKMPIDARLDMHGMTQAQAFEALKTFINTSFERNKRCLLVITGKGKSKSTSEDWLTPSQGVLKQKLPDWLADKTFIGKILKHYPAHPKDGGGGAFYVYLRKNN